MKHNTKKKKSSEAEIKYCQCLFCTSTYYTLELFQQALQVSKTEEELVHNIYQPLSRITISRCRWPENLADLFPDARSEAISNMFVYGRKYGLQPTIECLRSLIHVSRAGASYILREWRKHESPYTQVEEKSTSMIGHRVYPCINNNDFDIDSFTLLVDGLSADPNSEDSIVDQIDAKRFVIQVLTATDSKIVKQVVANLSVKFNLFDSFNENPPTPLFFASLRAELIPFAEASGLDKALITNFCAKAESILGTESTVDIKRLRQKTYNRKKTAVLTSLL